MLSPPRKRNRRKPPASGRQLSLALFGLLAEGGLRHAFAVTTFVVGAACIAWGLFLSLDRPIATVQAAGHFQRVAPVQIEEAVAPFRGQGFLSVDLDALCASIEKIDWVDRARVERRWPDGVRVYITEHVAAARWGEEGLMNTRGELFLRGAQRIPPELPQLNGPEGAESQVAQLYLDAYPRLLAVGMRLTRVELDARGAWSLQLANGVEVRLGRQDVAARLDRFIAVASPLLAARSDEVEYVDLRYSNGFSVGWNATTRVAGDAEDLTPDV